MGIVSRLQLNHPALGATGGASLHAQVEALYEKIGDAISSRWYQITDFDNSESQDLVHDMDLDITALRWDIYVYTGGQWVRVTKGSTPSRDDFTVAETSGNEDNSLTITNVSAGNDLLVAVVLVNDPIALEEGDVTDVDVTTTPPEDGQALVYEAASGKFKPGASGDASFKLQSISGSNLTIKGGPGIQLDSNQVLKTYDGAGSASTDYGADLVVDLSTLLGGAPANNTTYYPYIDLFALAGSPTTLSDTGEKVYGVTSAQLAISTQDPEQTFRDPSRYIPLGFVHSADSGNAWTGTGASFGTRPFRHHERLAKFLALTENYSNETITTAVASTVLSHNLSGKPQGVVAYYNDGTTERPLNPDSHILDVTDTEIEISSLGLTFGSGQKIVVKAWRFPTQPSMASAGNSYASGWFQDTATTTLAHGLADLENIRGYMVEEWDVTNGKYRFMDMSSLIVNFDATNFYLNWTGLTPSANLRYRIVSGSHPLAFAIPLHYGGFNKFVGIGPGSSDTLATAVAGAQPGDSILVSKSHSLSADLNINVADLRIVFMPGVVVTLAGALTNGVRLTAARIKLERASFKMEPTGAQARGISIEAADCDVDRADIELNTAQTLTDAVHITSGGTRAYAKARIKATLGTITNGLTNNDGASSAEVWG